MTDPELQLVARICSQAEAMREDADAAQQQGLVGEARTLRSWANSWRELADLYVAWRAAPESDGIFEI